MEGCLGLAFDHARSPCSTRGAHMQLIANPPQVVQCMVLLAYLHPNEFIRLIRDMPLLRQVAATTPPPLQPYYQSSHLIREEPRLCSYSYAALRKHTSTSHGYNTDTPVLLLCPTQTVPVASACSLLRLAQPLPWSLSPPATPARA